jgi:RNA polymerase sigma-70 factor, ECF subfamily
VGHRLGGDETNKAVRRTHASRGITTELAAHFDGHRAELVGYCSRRLGSRVDAEDAVQETLMRAWRARDRFEGRGAMRAWLYSIATNVCFDHLRSRTRRAHPIDLGPGSVAGASLAESSQMTSWRAAAPDAGVPEATDPAEVATSRDEVRLALIAALRELSPRQRTVLFLREVLRWRAREVADLLGVSVPSVNSLLQRARATLAAGQRGDADHQAPIDDAGRALVAFFADAFARHDFEALVAVLREQSHAQEHGGSSRSLLVSLLEERRDPGWAERQARHRHTER